MSDIDHDALLEHLTNLTQALNRGEISLENVEKDMARSFERSKEQMDALKQLPPYKGERIDDSDPYLGFAFDQSGQKCKTVYTSASERAWCECSEL